MKINFELFCSEDDCTSVFVHYRHKTDIFATCVIDSFIPVFILEVFTF